MKQGLLNVKEKIGILFFSFLVMCYLNFDFSNQGIQLFKLKGQGLVISSSAFCILLVVAYLYRNLSIIKVHSLWDKMHIAVYVLLCGYFSINGIYGKLVSAQQTSEVFMIGENKLCSGIGLLLAFIGGCVFFGVFIIGFLIAVKKLQVALNRKEDKYKKIVAKFDKWNVFVLSFLLLFCAWLPHVIINYPGSMTIDGWACYSQLVGNVGYNTQHPILFTRLLGKFISWGLNHFNDATPGLYALVFAQGFMSVLIVAYGIYRLYRIKTPKWICYIVLGFFMILPLFFGYSIIAITDAIFAPAVLLVAFELMWYLFEDHSNTKWQGYVFHSVLMIMGIGASFIRYNGKYVMLLTFATVLFRELILILKKKQKIAIVVVLAIVLLVPVFGATKTVRYLNNKYSCTNVSARAKFAVPMQQIAKTCLDRADCISDEDWALVSDVMTGSKAYYAKKYRVYNFDKIKRTFNPDATRTQLITFLYGWAKIGIKNPDCYAKAFIGQTYCLISPLVENVKFYMADDRYANRGVGMNYTDVMTEPESLASAKVSLEKYYNSFINIPIIGLIAIQGIYGVLLIILSVDAVYHKQWRVLIFAMPMLVTLLIAFVGPANMGNVRYTLPIYYQMPFLLIVYGLSLNQEKKVEE